MKYISASRINLMTSCAAKAFFRYEDKIKTPSHLPMVRGRVFDTALNAYFDWRIATGATFKNPRPEDDVTKQYEVIERMAEAEYFKALGEMDQSSDEYKELDQEVFFNQIMDGVDTYIIEKGDLVEQPVGTQVKVLKELTPEWAFIGYIDLLTETKIIDFKYVNKKPAAEPRESYWFQLNAYHSAIGKPELELELHYTSEPTKTLPHRVWVHDKDSGLYVDDKYTSTIIRDSLAMIDSGIYPTNRGDNLCTKRYCDYWNECEKRFGGKVRD